MSREENPTLKVIFDTGCALSQVIFRRMASSEPVLRRGGDGLEFVSGSEGVSGSAEVSGSAGVPRSPTIPGLARVPGPRPVKTKVPGPATQLLNDFFAEIDEIDTSKSIDASYVNVLLPGYRHARERARAGSRLRSRLRIETSFNMNSPNVPDQPPTSPSPTHSLNQSFSYSRPHVNSEEDLQELASRFQEIHTGNSELINADAKSISNSLPNLELGTFSNSSKEEFKDVFRKEKEIVESSPGFIAHQLPGITGSQMQKQIPKLIVSDAVSDDDYDEGEDEEEKNAIEILEALFGELEERENGSSEEEWKSAEEIFEGAENNGRDTGKEKTVATGDDGDIGIEMGYRADMSHGHDIDKSSEIHFFDQEAETEVRQYSALTQQFIENGSSAKRIDSLIEKDEKDKKDQAHPQSKTSDEFEVAPLLEFGEKGEEKWTKSYQNLNKDISVMESQKIEDHSEAEQDQHDSDGSANQIEDSTTSSTHHDTADEQNIAVDSTFKLTTSTSTSNSNSNSSTSSTSTSSTNDNIEEQKGPQFEMAALATGVMIASLWMIERKFRSS
ncbi:hypothetical protein OCU04_009775 [Sclerotinia nivalis]|uniref:Uncharacterized protein n=1 Tax=Sclerotinia nivalis TaxID=352851 RepID=A0A9X0AFR7_9HELO|nr:hypothetical protein OCU04_009775 [Sclerotinia nivalis]